MLLFRFEYMLHTLLKVQQMHSNSTFTLLLALIRSLCLQKQRASSRAQIINGIQSLLQLQIAKCWIYFKFKC